MYILHSNLPEKLIKAMKWKLEKRYLYERLMEYARSYEDIDIISCIIEDETRHYAVLNELYIDLVGRKVRVPEYPRPFFENYIEGVEKAIINEEESYLHYKNLYLSNKNPYVRKVFHRIFIDEKEHYIRFNYIYTRTEIL